MFRRLLFGLTSAVLLVAASTAFAEPEDFAPCPSGPPSEEALQARFLEFDLSGEWRMFLPAGWEQPVTIDRLGQGRYYVRPPYVMEGTYFQHGNRLTRVSKERLDDGAKPESELPEYEAFAWLVRSPQMLTLLENSESRSDDYLGATLFRPRDVRRRESSAKSEATPQRDPAAEPSGKPAAPFAIDVPETELDVRLFPGTHGERHRNGELVFPITIRNLSDAAIALELPSERGAVSSIAARVRRIEPVGPENAEQPTLLMHAYRVEGDEEPSTVTVGPGEEVQFDVRLAWFADVHPRRRLPPATKYEIHLAMTFVAEETLQHVSGPRGSVVTFDASNRVR